MRCSTSGASNSPGCRGTLRDTTELRVTIPDELAEWLASEAADRGTSPDDLAADLLRQNIPATRRLSLSFIGMFEGVPGAPSVAELERQLEDGGDDGFGR